MKYSHLTLIKGVNKTNSKFRCDCGSEINLTLKKVRMGYIKSCGNCKVDRGWAKRKKKVIGKTYAEIRTAYNIKHPDEKI